MKKMLALFLAVFLILSLSSCASQPLPVSVGMEEEESAPVARRKERRESEKQSQEELNAANGIDEQEEEEPYTNPWKNYVEPQLDEGMGRVFPTLENPAGATAMFIRYYQNWDMRGALKCISDFEEYSMYDTEALAGIYGPPQDLYDGLMAFVLQESQFSIIDEKIYGNTAVVRLQCKAFSGEVIMDLYADILVEAGLYNYYEEYDERILNNLNFNIIPIVKLEADAYLVKCPDGLWRLDIDADENEEVMDILTGNLMGAVDEYYYEYYFDKYYGDWYDEWYYGTEKNQGSQDYDEWYRNWYRENFGREQDNKAA